MVEGSKSKYKWYAKMYVEMLLRLVSLPFVFLILIILAPVEILINRIWEFRGQPCPDCRYKLKDVKLSGYTIEGHYYKRCPNCGCVTAMEKEE